MKTVSDSIKARFSSAFDSFMGEFHDAVNSGDRLGAALASAHLSQLGLSMFELFGAGSHTLAQSKEEHVACHEAGIVVRGVLDKYLDEWSKVGQIEKPN